MYVPDSPSNSSRNVTGIDCPVYQESTASQVFKTLAYVSIILLSLFGNVVVVSAIYRNRRMRTVTNLFISNLAVSDLLITVLGMPNMITQLYLKDKWIFGAALCKMVVFFQSASVAGSVLTLLAVTWDRFWSIMFPLRPRMTKSTTKRIVCIVWFLAFSTMAPFLYAQRVIVGAGGYEICLEIWEPLFDGERTAKDYTVVLFVTLYALPLLTMSAFYSVILRKLWRRKVPGNHSSRNEKKSRDSKKKVIRMLMTVTLLFAICWLPLYVYQFIVFFAWFPCFDSNYTFYFVSLFFGHANSAINPFLYSLFQKRYRSEFTAALVCNKRSYFRRRRHSSSWRSLLHSARSGRLISWMYRSMSTRRPPREGKQLKAEVLQMKRRSQEMSDNSTSNGIKANQENMTKRVDAGSILISQNLFLDQVR